MLVLSLGLLLALLPAKIAGAISHFEPTSFRTGGVQSVRASITSFLCTRAHSKLRFSSSGMRMNAGTSADAHRPTSPGKADSLPDGFGRHLLWYTKCGDSCNSPEACESPCYCQPNSTGGASQKGNSQSQNQVCSSCSFCGAMRTHPPHIACGDTQGGLSSCCALFSMSIIVDPMGASGPAAWWCVCLHSRPQDAGELDECHCGAGPTGMTGERCTRKRTRAM